MADSTSCRISGVIPPTTLVFIIRSNNTWFDFGYSASRRLFDDEDDDSVLLFIGCGCCCCFFKDLRVLCPTRRPEDRGRLFTVTSIVRISIARDAGHWSFRDFNNFKDRSSVFKRPCDWRSCSTLDRCTNDD